MSTQDVCSPLGEGVLSLLLDTPRATLLSYDPDLPLPLSPLPPSLPLFLSPDPKCAPLLLSPDPKCVPLLLSPEPKCVPLLLSSESLEEPLCLCLCLPPEPAVVEEGVFLKMEEEEEVGGVFLGCR